MTNRFSFAISIIFTVSSFGTFVGGCASDNSNTKNIQQQVSSTPSSVDDPARHVEAEPVHVSFEYPYDEQGQFIFTSDKEFHQKDCAGYRSHYGIEKLTLPCESDNDLFFMKDNTWSGRPRSSTDMKLYIGYRDLDSENFAYSTIIELSSSFLSDHVSWTNIRIEGATAQNVLASGSMSIFLWNYQDRRWKNTPELFLCDNTNTLRSSSSKSDMDDVSITCTFHEEYSIKMNAILHNEEVFHVRMATWESDEVKHGGSIVEKKHAYYIPTPTFRKDMHKAWRHRHD
jgi:hypothetical protein